jgi:PKD repeat protein
MWVTAAALAAAFLMLAAAAHAAQPKPKADFGFAPASPQPGDLVTFTSSSQPANGTTIVGYRWDLDGNGSLETDTGSSPTATFTYPAAATVQVRLQVTDSRGGRDGVRHTVTIGDGGGGGGSGPVASFTFSPSSPVAGQPVLFTSTSSDPDAEITEQAWDLDGDANFDNGLGITALRTFAAPGSYVVGIRVTDANGKVAFYSQTVPVSGLGGPLGTSATPRGSSPRLLSPFPVVRIAGRILRRGTLVRLLSVHAPSGARVSIRCSGRGCPFAKQVRTTGGGPTAKSSKQVRVRRLERLLRPGVVIRVLITRAESIGKYTRFKILSGKPPARVDRCLNPGSSRPVACPGA